MSKHKLGKLMHATVNSSKEKGNEVGIKQYKCLAREVDLPRISVFIIEKFESKLVNMFKISGIEKVWHKPANYFIDEKLKVTVFYLKSISLFEHLHGETLNSKKD